MSSLCGVENEETRVTSICSEEDCSTKEARKTDKLECARAEMGEAKEANERLEMMLERVEKDYHSLQLRFFDILQRGTSNSKRCLQDSCTSTTTSPDEVEEHHDLVSLCLGTSPSEPKRERVEICNSSNNKAKENNEDLEANLTLGLDSKSSLLSMELVSDLSTINSSEELKEEAEPRRTCSTNKSVRDKDDGVDEISEQSPSKRARVCVRARCDTPTMIDGCQWRKYGQKIAKGNPCPRAYYRCTVAPACPVRKQVQRCADDMSILITTYEGTHNHPLPVSATAMASTTSAAASMLLSASSSSTSSFGHSPTLFTALNFTHHFDQSSARSKHAFIPNTTASHLFPTITLDLTSASPNSSTTRSHFSPSSPRFFHPLSLSFNTPQSFWFKGLRNYATMPNDEKTHISTLNQGNLFQEQFYQHCIKSQAPYRDALAETLSRAISTDPGLRSAIAAAVSSIERQGLAIGNRNEGEILGSGLSLKLGDSNPQFKSSNPLNQNGKAGLICNLNRTSSSSSSSSSSHQGGNLMLLQPSRPFTLSKSSTTCSNTDNIKHWVQEINSHR